MKEYKWSVGLRHKTTKAKLDISVWAPTCDDATHKLTGILIGPECEYEWTAQKAFSGLGEFVPGDHCRFCRGKAQCRARAGVNTALRGHPGGVKNHRDTEQGHP